MQSKDTKAALESYQQSLAIAKKLAVRLRAVGLTVVLTRGDDRFIPLDESVIRVLATDSYRYLHDILESRRAELARAAQQFGLRRGSIWYLELTGLTPLELRGAGPY